MSDLLHPDIPALVEKWRHVVSQVIEANKYDTIAELSWLAEAASRATSILELGSYIGISTEVMALANPDATIWCVDDWADGNTHEMFKERMKEELRDDRIRFFVGKTGDGLKMLAGYRYKADMIFCDAGHLYNDLISDIIGAMPLLDDGGILCGHDFREQDEADGVTRAVRELLPDHVVVVDSLWCCMAKA